MPRLVFFFIFLAVAIIPFALFALLNKSPDTYSGSHRFGSYYHSRGPSFYFLHFDDDGYRGRGFSSGAYQGGGFRGGK